MRLGSDATADGWRRLLSLLALLLCACRPQAAPESFNGVVEVEATQVAAPLAGRLTELAVQRGAQVAAGAPLFALEHQAESDSVREAEARVAQAEATVRDLDKGQRPSELAAQQAAIAAQAAALKRSESELKRQRELAAQGFVSPSALVSLQAQRDADAARLEQLRAQLRTAHLGGREDVRQAAEAEAAAARAALAQAEWRLAQKALRAPAAAVVEDTLYRVGEWVSAGSPVVSLIEPAAIRLRFFVPETRIAGIAPGQRVRASCDGCAAPIDATVRFVAREAEFTPPVIYSRGNRERLVFLVEAWPAPSDAAKLRPGLPIDVRLVEK
jgi:HlyD family secretion protein